MRYWGLIADPLEAPRSLRECNNHQNLTTTWMFFRLPARYMGGKSALVCEFLQCVFFKKTLDFFPQIVVLIAHHVMAGITMRSRKTACLPPTTLGDKGVPYDETPMRKRNKKCM